MKCFIRFTLLSLFIYRHLLALMTILAQALLALVRSHLVALFLLSVWHSCFEFIMSTFRISSVPYPLLLIFSMKLLQGLKAGRS